MEQEAQVVLRDASRGSDHAFLYSTWRNALWFSERRDMKEADEFYKKASEKIAALLKKPDIKVRVACLGDDPDLLLGYSVMQNDHLEFVYVKIDYRRKGIGRILTNGFKTFSDPETKIGKFLGEKLLKEKHGREEETKAQPD
jgi:ribosomal protein S18 acetylase RimI-like enzyme